jgi:hypothetical protein
MVELSVCCAVCARKATEDRCCSPPARVMRKFPLGSAFLKQAAAIDEVSASKPCDSFGFHFAAANAGTHG